MTPTATPPAPPPPKARRRKPGRSVVIPNVDWDTYEKLLAAFGDRRNPRLTYDRGDLEIMAPPSNEHEEDADFLGDLAKLVAAELGLPLRPGGGFTMKRKDLKRGVEPDRCFWVQSAPRVDGVRKIDLAVHAPPDLVIEVDVTNSSLDKFGVYAKLGVPELWRLNGDDLRFHRLGSTRKYAEVPTSAVFAGVAPADLMGHLLQARGSSRRADTLDAFRVRFRQWIAAQQSPPPP